MNAWLFQHGAALTQTLKRMGGAPLAHLLTIAVIGISLALPAGLYVLVDNLHRLAGGLQGEPQISLFVARDAGKKDLERIAAQISQHAGVRESRFISRDAALKELEQAAGLKDVVAALERNPLPDVYLVRPRTLDPDMLEKMRAELQALPKVELAQLDSAWAKRLHALLKTGRNGILILAVLLGAALLAITGNTIRLQILTQRDEIQVSRLIGATDRFVRRPFLYLGALLGLAGGLAALAVILGSITALNASLVELSRLYASSFALALPGPAETAVLLGGATLTGWLGAYVSVSHYLKETV
jgi:cell division transport system permease protein